MTRLASSPEHLLLRLSCFQMQDPETRSGPYEESLIVNCCCSVILLLFLAPLTYARIQLLPYRPSLSMENLANLTISVNTWDICTQLPGAQQFSATKSLFEAWQLTPEGPALRSPIIGYANRSDQERLSHSSFPCQQMYLNRNHCQGEKEGEAV